MFTSSLVFQLLSQTEDSDSTLADSTGNLAEPTRLTLTPLDLKMINSVRITEEESAVGMGNLQHTEC